MPRPSSARPAPPRVKKNEQEPQEVHIVYVCFDIGFVVR